MDTQNRPSKEQRHEAWGKALGAMLKADLSYAEKAALIAVVIAERDDEDGSETVADIRRVIDRGLASLTEKGVLKLERGQYRLATERSPQRSMKVDAAEPEQDAEPAPYGEKPEVA